MQVLGVSQTRASRNLNLLHDAGFLKVRREGLWAYYSIDKSGLTDHLTLLLDAVGQGLKSNETASRDRERLKDAQRLGPRCCNPVQVKKAI
jgi:ArsR family transcriptional regulator